MTDVLRTIHLDGSLGRLFGRTHRLVINSPAEAVRALCNVIDGFQQEIEKHQAGFHVFVDEVDISEQELQHPTGRAAIRIMPIITAAGGGFFQVLAGAALIGAAFFTGGASLAAWGATQMVLGGLGGALLFSGAAQMLAPSHKGLASVDSVDNGASYHFNGPVNLTAQGNCVPLLYGEMWTGSVTVSAGIYNEDVEA